MSPIVLVEQPCDTPEEVVEPLSAVAPIVPLKVDAVSTMRVLQVRRHPTGSAQLVVPIIVELSPMMCVPLLETAVGNKTESLGLMERRVHRCRRVVEP